MKLVLPDAVASNSVSDTYASVCTNSHPCISSLSLPSSLAIGEQITDVVTSGGQSSTKFVLRTIGACSRAWEVRGTRHADLVVVPRSRSAAFPATWNVTCMPGTYCVISL